MRCHASKPRSAVRILRVVITAALEVLTSFIRAYSPEQWPENPPAREARRWTRPDVQAVVTVIGRRDMGPVYDR